MTSDNCLDANHNFSSRTVEAVDKVDVVAVVASAVAVSDVDEADAVDEGLAHYRFFARCKTTIH